MIFEAYRSSYINNELLDKTAIVWSNGVKDHTWQVHDKVILSCAFSSSGKYLSTCCEDGTVKIWNVNDWSLLHSIKAHNRYHQLIKPLLPSHLY